MHVSSICWRCWRCYFCSFLQVLLSAWFALPRYFFFSGKSCVYIPQIFFWAEVDVPVRFLSFYREEIPTIVFCRRIKTFSASACHIWRRTKRWGLRPCWLRDPWPDSRWSRFLHITLTNWNKLNSVSRVFMLMVMCVVLCPPSTVRSAYLGTHTCTSFTWLLMNNEWRRKKKSLFFTQLLLDHAWSFCFPSKKFMLVLHRKYF